MSTMTDDNTTRGMCEAHADNLAGLLDDLWARIDAEEDFEGEDSREYLDSLPLEVVWEKGEPFAVVMGTGGPHVEIRGGTRHDGNGFTVHVYWSGEHVTRYAAGGSGVARTGEYFRELVEESSGN